MTLRAEVLEELVKTDPPDESPGWTARALAEWLGVAQARIHRELCKLEKLGWAKRGEPWADCPWRALGGGRAPVTWHATDVARLEV